VSSALAAGQRLGSIVAWPVALLAAALAFGASVGIGAVA
jgi:hypothetical protein